MNSYAAAIRKHPLRTSLVFTFVGFCFFTPFVSGDDGTSAAALVNESGVAGGLVVHVGELSADEAAALRLNERYLVQIVSKDAQTVPAIREKLRQAGLTGVVTVVESQGERLPYADNLVNLLLVRNTAAVSPDEIERVLAPLGMAYLESEGRWEKVSNPWPDEIDEWTHFLHEPDNNAVADDVRVGPARHMQWVVGPRWARSHDHLASMSAAVSAAGRIYYIIDEGAISSVNEPSRWMLVARDAFSGVLLWKKEVTPWEDRLRPFRSGPAELPRRLVAVGDRVFVTPGYGKPVVALNAATGELLHTYAGTENTLEIVFHEGKLYLVVSEPLADESGTTGKIIRRRPPWRGAYGVYVTQYPPKHIQCVAASTGELVWSKQDDDSMHVMPITLAVSEGRVFFENEKEILSLDAASGDVAWRATRPIAFHRYAWSSPTLVIQDGVVLSADRAADANLDTGGADKKKLEWLVTSDHLLTGGQIMAFSAKTGEKLWEAPCHEGFNFPVDLFVAGGRVYSGELAWGRQPGITQVYDVKTGEIIARRPTDQQCYTIGFGHARCYRNKATTKYVIHGRSGVEFLDMNSDKVVADHWIRGTCQYGILPCNGLVYVPPHSCACYVTSKLNSFNALAPARIKDEGLRTNGERRLKKGAAYADGPIRPSTFVLRPSKDWPSYRRDGARSGATGVALSPQLKPGWEKKFDGPLTAPVIAEGKVFFAQRELHTVHACSADDGTPTWHYTAGGRVDSPPTVWAGHVYFGSADGWIYCLRADDGALAWRFRAAPSNDQVLAYEQLESVWPVHGNVLLVPSQDPSASAEVVAVAGRSSFLDGGLFLYRLNAHTGQLLSEQRVSHRDPETEQEPQNTVRGVSMPGALPDVLSTNGDSLFMRHMRFDMQGTPQPQDVEHLYSPAGFLDDSWWHRTYWQIGTNMGTGYGGWPQTGNRRISGRLLVTSGERVYGFGRKSYAATGSHLGMRADYHLFAARSKTVESKPPAGQSPKGKRQARPTSQVEYLWSEPLPFYARAMVLAGDTLFLAGPNEVPAFSKQVGNSQVSLWAVSATDGTKVAQYRLEASPVFDGMAACDSGLYFTTVDGRLVCYQSSAAE